MYSDWALPKVEPLCVFREGFWYGSEVSERTVDLFNTRTATAPWAGWDGLYGGDLQKGEEKERADRMKGKVNNREQSDGGG